CVRVLALELLEDARRPIRGQIVDDDDLVRGFGLLERRDHAGPDRRLLVVGGDHDRQGGALRGGGRHAATLTAPITPTPAPSAAPRARPAPRPTRSPDTGMPRPAGTPP